MTDGLLRRYATVFRIASFRVFWSGFAFSSIGDSMTRVALIWYVFEVTGSARALGLLSVCYTGPILIGGLVAGSLLDRFDRRKVMMADNLVRGIAVAAIPILHVLGRLELWHVYTVAAIYGLLMMISLAGGPSLIPSLVPKEQLITVNALEVLGFTLGDIAGPPLAGLLIPLIGVPNVLVIDVLSYGLFALALSRVRYSKAEAGGTATVAARYRLRDAFELLRSNRILLSTTTMFMVFNIGRGFLFVWLPIYTSDSLGHGATLYGVLLGAVAVGGLCSSVLAGSLKLPLTLGALICLCQFCSGVALLPLLMSNLLLALLGMTLYGFFGSPITIWAQTLRMAIIPAQLRGRTFALLRMLMRGSGPIGGAVAGLVFPVLGMLLTIGLTGVFTGAPGLVGYRVRQLREDELPTRDRIALSEA